MVSEYDFDDLTGKKAPETAADQPIPLNEIQLLAERITRDHTFKTTKDNGELFWYNGSVYVSGQEWRIKERCRQIVKNIKAHQIQEVINYIKDTTYIDRSDFDSNPSILNVANGLLNLQTRVLEPQRSDYLSIVQLPVNYDPKAECATIIKFLRDVLRHEDIGIIFRLISYCLLRDCRYQVAVMLYGKGANGKGTLLDLVTAFLGIDNCSHRSLQSIDTNRFAIADLYGKMANTYADLQSMKLSETGNFKMAVTGDWVEGEFKFENAFKFKNRAKLWFSANEIPESDDKSDAFYRRWLIFHFDKQWLYGKEDVDLFKKLTTPDELSGLLNVALVSLNRLDKEGGFHGQTIVEIRRDYEIHTNDVNAFLHEECKVDITNSDYSTLATDAYAAYVNFCVKRGTRPIDMNPFGKRLADKGIYNQRHKIGGQSGHYYDGMILRRKLTGEDQTTID